MRILSPVILLITLLFVRASLESPHGDDLKISCAECHTTDGWKLDRSTMTFDHATTKFTLEGQHYSLDCRLCHISLIFSKADPECSSCHNDIHEQSVGMDCGRCHTPHSWLVGNITEIHRMSRFPLMGAHLTADCQDCHLSASTLNFQPLGVECADCHLDDYLATTNPDHELGGFSTDCLECHLMNAFTWTGPDFNHSFFPLTEGHAISDCRICHIGGDYANTSAECYSCHQDDYDATSNPNHLVAGIPTNCDECHTTRIGWKPADFAAHDALFFPIYSGEHNGEWANCTECHTSVGNYSLFSCIDCHEHNQPEMDDEHEGINGYLYNSQACYDCHPTGSAEGGFNHAQTAFPLDGAHTSVDCALCHVNGYSGTSTYCFDCHSVDFNQTTNPNHGAIGISDNCALCHTTLPGWIPATFNVHNDYYALSGAHASIANNCAACHNGNYNTTPNTCVGCHLSDYQQSINPNHTNLGITDQCEICHTPDPGWEPALFPVHNDFYLLEGAHAVISGDCNACHNGNYNNTPNTCFGCHIDDYNQTTDPPHASAQFPTECLTCHTQIAWEPSTFNHDAQYFPIYSGSHNGKWNTCSECHTDPQNYGIFSCIDCHEHNQADTDDDHQGVPGYQYNSIACLECHPTGNALMQRRFK